MVTALERIEGDIDRLEAQLARVGGLHWDEEDRLKVMREVREYILQERADRKAEEEAKVKAKAEENHPHYETRKLFDSYRKHNKENKR